MNVVADGLPMRRAAERFQVSHATAARWAACYRDHGAAGMADRPCRRAVCGRAGHHRSVLHHMSFREPHSVMALRPPLRLIFPGWGRRMSEGWPGLAAVKSALSLG